jgi:hypothetical protein
MHFRPSNYALVSLPLVGVLLLVAAAPAPAQPNAGGAQVSSGYQADAAVLRRALETLHPGLYRYNSPVELERRFAELEERLARATTPAAAYLAIARFTSTLRCGHTFPNPANQPDAIADAVFRRTPRVPFYFRWLDGRMIVTHDASAEHAFPRGTEVLAVNGVPIAAILSRLLEYARTDGANEAKRIANLGVHPAERWEAFDVYFPLVFPQPTGQWTFKVRTPSDSPRVVRAIPATVAQRMAVYDSLRRISRDTTTPPWTFRVDDDGVATLAMPSWVTFNDHWDWQGFIHRAFAELAARRATTLIVDVRGNEGGTSVGDVILAHLTDRDIVPTQLRRYTRYRSIPTDLKPYLDTWDRSFDDWGAAATPAPAPSGGGIDGYFHLTRADDDSAGSVIHPVAPRFGGTVFVLVGADNSSATFEFALAVREQRLATLVGQPTGGNQGGINGGAFYFLRLPNSGVEVDLPLIGFFPPSNRPNAGLTPDVVVRVTPDDVARGRDPEVAAVRTLLARASRGRQGTR